MKIGVSGGSGLYELDGLQDVRHTEVTTPFGEPSDTYVGGTLAGREVYFLPRHGKGHRLLPSEINHRANIYGFKTLGVECLISISAVGSLKEDIHPRNVVLPDQYFDRTKGSLQHTFFGEGIVAHIAFAEPTCPVLRGLISESLAAVLPARGLEESVRVHTGGTYVNMEGPAFSTKAESEVYRRLGFDIIGMTSLPEAKLAREAEICYQPIAMVTDYDCWHETEEAVTVQAVVEHLLANTALAKAVLEHLVSRIPETRSCACGHALEHALLTDRNLLSAARREALEPILSKYL